MATWKSAAYDGRYLQLDISESVNVVGNSSTLSWTLTSTGGASTYYTIDTTTVTINGTTVYSKDRTYWDDRVFPAKKGSVSGTITVAHNSNGSKTIAVGFSTRVYIYGSQEYGGSMTLTTIDRSAPTVTFSTSNVTANGFKISATSSATADIWQYSTNGGSSWTQFSTTASTSASVTLSSLSPNTNYTVRIRARRQYNHVYGTSGSSTVKTLGGAVVNSVNTVTADNTTVSITINVTVYEASYTNTLVLKNGSTTILTISGLSWSKGTANRTVTLTSAQRTTLLNAMASIKSFTGTFAVSSYSGSTQIGSTSSKTAAVLTTATNSAPTISGFTYADSYTTTKNLTGNDQLFLQDYSTLKVTPGTATAKNGASISNYTASCNGLSASNSTGSAITVGKIAKSGSVTVTLSVTDSRGYTAETSQTVTVIPYTKPKISSVTLRRTNDIEAEMQLVFNGTISAITVDSAQKNSLLYVRYRYKATSASSYSSYVSIISAVTQSGTSFSYSNLELRSLASDQSWDVHIQIRDQLNSLSSLDLYYVIPQGTPLVALRKQKVGINTPTPEAALDVVGDANVSGTLTAATLSGALAPAKLSSAVPISKGGTGATAAASARTNLAVLPLAGGTVTGQVKSTYANAGGFLIEHGTSSKEACFKATRTDTDVSIFMGVGSGGTNHGLYSYKLAKWLVYADGSNVYCNGTATNVTGTVTVAHGGTGATSAAAARTNLGVAVTSLYSGSITGTNSCTFNYGRYNFYIIMGLPTSSSAKIGLVVPKAILTTSDVKYQIADDANYCSFYLKYSGSTVTLTRYGGNGSITNVYGVN